MDLIMLFNMSAVALEFLQNFMFVMGFICLVVIFFLLQLRIIIRGI